MAIILDVTNRCTCDYDCQGDPARFVRVSKCALHQACEFCGAFGISQHALLDGEIICATCAREMFS